MLKGSYVYGITTLKNTDVRKHYKELTFGENRERLRLLMEFQGLVAAYFENSRLNLMNGSYNENQEASEAREAINGILQQAYSIIRCADVRTSSASSASVTMVGHSQNIDLILNIFNLGRNDIPPHAVMDYIERAVDVYRSNRLNAFIRTINPFFWISVFVKHIAGENKKKA